LIHDVFSDHRLDIVVITESWITTDAPNAIKQDIAPTGYLVLHAHRGSASSDYSGGGIALEYLCVVNVGQFGEFKALFVKLNSEHSPVIIAYLYIDHLAQLYKFFARNFMMSSSK